MDKEKIKELLQAKKSIGEVFHRHSEELQNMTESARVVNPEYVLDFARRIALTTRAPPLWKPGFPLDNSFGHGPCPQLEELNGGYLRRYQFQSSSKYVREKNHLRYLQGDYTQKEPIQEIFDYLGVKLETSVKDASSSDQFSKTHLEKRSITDIVMPDNENANKKSRVISLSFGLSDSEEED